MKASLIDNIVYPIALVLILVVVHFSMGSMSLPIETNNAQRDFNTALGTSLLSGVFLFSIRSIHKNLAYNLFGILSIRNEQRTFVAHRQQMAHTYKKHIIWSTTIGFIMPIVYMLVEGVITRIHEKEVFIVAISAIPFWLLLSLFLFQLVTNNKYLWVLLSKGNLDTVSSIKLYRKVINVSLTTFAAASTVTLVLPIFWYKQPIHTFDFLFILALTVFFALFLLTPLTICLYRIRKLNYALTKEIDTQLESLIKESVTDVKSSEIECLLHDEEKFGEALSTRQSITLLFCLCLPLLSWGVFLVTEH